MVASLFLYLNTNLKVNPVANYSCFTDAAAIKIILKIVRKINCHS